MTQTFSLTHANELHDVYIAAYQSYIQAQDELKVLESAWKLAGETAKYSTKGTTQERLVAVQVAVAPFKAAYAEKEQEIALLRKVVDTAYDAWYFYGDERENN